MILKRMSIAIAVAVMILGTAAGLSYARSVGLIGPETAKRTIQVIIGLTLAAYANLMPKDVGPWRASALAVARAQSTLRVGGWSMTLAGLAHAGFWAFAPLHVANVGGMIAVASAMAVTLSYGGRALIACRSKQTTH